MAKSNAMNARTRLALAKLRPWSQASSLAGIPGIVQPRSKLPPLKADLTGCARTGLEKAIAKIWSHAPPGPLLQERNPDRQRLLFRAFYVPTFAAALIGASRGLDAKSKDWQPPWWLIDHAIHLVASERMFLEESVCSGSLSSRWVPRSLKRTDAPAKLPQLTLDWFPHDPGQIRNLEGRLDEWRHFTRKSVRLYFTVTECREIEGLLSPEDFGAMMGVVERLTPFPVKVMPELISLLRRLSRNAINRFHHAAAKSTPSQRRANYDLDTWLIEVHPLTWRFDWRPHNLIEIALVAFGNSMDCLTSAEDLGHRIHDLDLKLSPKASRPGRPSKGEHTTASHLTPTESLAAFIRSIGEDNQRWMLGSLGLTKPFE